MSQYTSLRAQFFEGDIRTESSPDKPTDPIAEMLSGNAQWAKAVTESDPDFFPTTARAQYPHTLWIGCGDSRVPETVITGAKPGDIFVKRNIGNQARHDDESLMATLTFAVEVLGVEHVIICGHSGCGAVAASLAASRREAVRGQDPIITIEGFPADSPLNLWLAPLTIFIGSLGLSSTPHEEALPVAVRENIIAQVNSVCETEVIQNAWRRKILPNITVHGWVYDLETGRIQDLGISRGPGSLSAIRLERIAL
ncbi:carbonic anhydrase [Lentinula edodes]|uniref:Carbonic anhydrase n=1 Tax=Lentinula lateritia TaxID=40482 RepID=A0A9W9A7K1_9AGAR|nr:carbonic anhydrase [Lentinula edodes]